MQSRQSTNERGPLEYQLRLPGADAEAWAGPSGSAGSRQGIPARPLLHGAYALAHRKGGDFGFDAFLDIKKDGKTVASIERGPTDGYGHRVLHLHARRHRPSYPGASNGYFACLSI